MLKVAIILNSSHDDGARPWDAKKAFEKIWGVTQDYNEIQEVMDQMYQYGWATRSQYGRTAIYKITK